MYLIVRQKRNSSLLKDRIIVGKYFAIRSVTRSKFEALRRFPDYSKLNDATLSRVEAGMEYRVFADDVEGFPLQIMTPALLNQRQDSHPRLWRP